MSPTSTCTTCREPVTDTGAKFCSHCGAVLAPTAASESHPQPTQAAQPTPRPCSTAFVNVVRLLSAAAMFSAMFAVIRFDSTSGQGRVLIVLGVMTALSGQLFVMQATKATPPPWVQVPLTVLGIGIAAVLVAWVMAVS